MASKEWTVYARRSCSGIYARPIRSTYVPSGYREIGKVVAVNQQEAIGLIWTKLLASYSESKQDAAS